ncbi:hypothetical protein SO802_031833 [Lithocarpus litseifolius]|uniref:Uncharacterized protein n=1 Tax=Lithocarpus litseifolius TaxID=425828 RepID=A0AAW2BP09_9ROSI
MIPGIKSSSLLRAKASNSPPDDDLEVTRSISNLDDRELPTVCACGGAEKSKKGIGIGIGIGLVSRVANGWIG